MVNKFMKTTCKTKFKHKLKAQIQKKQYTVKPLYIGTRNLNEISKTLDYQGSLKLWNYPQIPDILRDGWQSENSEGPDNLQSFQIYAGQANTMNANHFSAGLLTSYRG